MAPLAGVHLLMLATAAFGLHAIAREVDRSDTLRAGEAVSAAFRYQLGRLEMVTVNNAVYTEAWKAVGGAKVNTKWALENWTVAPPDLPGHHGILLLEPDGRPIVGTRAGAPMTESAMAEMAALVGPTLRKLPREGAASVKGLITTGPVPMLVAAANIVPEATDQTPATLRGAKRQLVLIHPMNDRLLATMNETVGGERLALGAADRAGNKIVLTTDAGAAVSLGWRSREPGRAAMLRSLRVIAPVLLLVTAFLILAMRAGLASSRALKHAATVDPLTRLPNRAAFSAELDRCVAADRPFALGMIDLDGFKQVNDRYGHLAGDDLLRNFGRILAQVAEHGDAVGRLGGDEFAFLCADRGAAERLTVRLQLEISQPVIVDFQRLRIEASIGIAEFTPGRSAADVMGDADVELYDDKRRRKAERGLNAPALGADPPKRRGIRKAAAAQMLRSSGSSRG